jgi:hypothetical protein
MIVFEPQAKISYINGRHSAISKKHLLRMSAATSVKATAGNRVGRFAAEDDH